MNNKNEQKALYVIYAIIFLCLSFIMSSFIISVFENLFLQESLNRKFWFELALLLSIIIIVLFSIVIYKHLIKKHPEYKRRREESKSNRPLNSWRIIGLLFCIPIELFVIILFSILGLFFNLAYFENNHFIWKSTISNFVIKFYKIIPFITHYLFMRYLKDKYPNLKKKNNDYKKNNESNNKKNTNSNKENNNYDSSSNAEIFNYFKGCTTLEQLNKRHKNLARTYHPDTGAGDEETMKEINRQYDELIKKYK